MPVEGRLFSVAVGRRERAGADAQHAGRRPSERSKTAEASLRRVESENRELRAILDTATDGVVVLDRAGRVLSANRSAEALFGYEAAEFAELHASATCSRPKASAPRSTISTGSRSGGAAGLLNDGREVIGRVRAGRPDPAVHDHGADRGRRKILRGVPRHHAWKKTEEELLNAKQQAEKASTAKSEFLAKISHEIRTPLNAIIGFSEVMMEERFGPIGNERYRQYLKDIHTSGGHLISLLNDLLDLSKIEAGKLDLTFASVNLNDLTQQCVAHHAAAGQPRAHHHPHLAAAEPAADRRRRALGAPDRAQSAVELDQVHRRRRPGDRLDRARPTTARWCCACATPASA